jgi:hypothetical protein
MPAKHPKRPRDPNKLGKLIVDLDLPRFRGVLIVWD